VLMFLHCVFSRMKANAHIFDCTLSRDSPH
jgi:hypothetical protein